MDTQNVFCVVEWIADLAAMTPLSLDELEYWHNRVIPVNFHNMSSDGECTSCMLYLTEQELNTSIQRYYHNPVRGMVWVDQLGEYHEMSLPFTLEEERNALLEESYRGA